jgi:hypothetical protein
MARHCISPRSTELNIGAAGVPGDDGKFCADSFLEQLAKIVTRIAGAGGAAFRRRRRIANVMDGFIRRRRPHVQQRFRRRGAANPGEFRPIELHFLAGQQLIDIKPGVHNDYTEAIRLCSAVNVIGGHCGPAPSMFCTIVCGLPGIYLVM